MKSTLRDKIAGCLYGGAIGDAMGSPTEGMSPEEIRKRFGEVKEFREPANEDWKAPGNLRPLEKGNGHFSDDTLMIECLLSVYREAGRHLDAYDVAEGLVHEIADVPRYVPELRRETPVLPRLFLAEQYLYVRHRMANAEPREGGMGNMVNCGAAMYMSPVGIMNAGDPDRAYREAIDLAGAHQTSYGREAAGIMAAVVAEALKRDSTVESIVATATALAKDGTKAAIEAVLDAARRCTSWQTAREPLRAAMEPYDTVKEFRGHRNRADGQARRPSRQHAIEELPIALGLLVIAHGDPIPAIYGGVNYGNDADSIAGMAGAVAGAHRGVQALPADLRSSLDAANRRSFDKIADAAYETFLKIFRADVKRHDERIAAIDIS